MSLAKLAAPLVIVTAMAVPAFAQDRGSDADQEACTPDVFRLCQDFIPDEGRIVSCLESKGPQLSGACHKVMFSPSPSSKPAGIQEADITASVRKATKHHRRRKPVTQ